MLSKTRILATVFVAGLSIAAAHAQDPVTAFPGSYSLALDNSILAVVRVHYGPHEKIGVHDHSKNPTIYVYLNNSSPVRFEHFEKNPYTLIRPPTVKGSFRVSPGRLERHSVENLGDSPSDYLRVELKQMPFGKLRSFRGEAPQEPLQPRDSMEFTTPTLAIERIICSGSSACPVKPSPDPSLIVAFTPMSFGAPEKQAEKLEAGAVRWLASSKAASIKQDSASPAHMLRILFPAVRK